MKSKQENEPPPFLSGIWPETASRFKSWYPMGYIIWGWRSNTVPIVVLSRDPWGHRSVETRSNIHCGRTQEAEKGSTTILEEIGVARLDRLRAADAGDRLFLHRHTLLQKARGGIGPAKSPSPGPYPQKLQAGPLLRVLWRGSLRRYMRGDQA